MHNALKHRKIKRLVVPHMTSDGAGVVLYRGIGSAGLSDIDPFLLFDHFGSSNPDDYIAGFPMHPHRGIETVTYMISGRIRHSDSVGNSGVIEAGGVQWMTAGSGIMHEEMPEMESGLLEGFQLWVNLRSDQKMLSPSYREVDKSGVPAIKDNGKTVRVIAGSFEGLEGAFTGISGSPSYFDVDLEAGKTFESTVQAGASIFAYVYRGGLEGIVKDGEEGDGKNSRLLVVFSKDGETVSLTAGPEGVSLLLISGQPIDEPIARYGPFVMNTEAEIRLALRQLNEGTFIQ